MSKRQRRADIRERPASGPPEPIAGWSDGADQQASEGEVDGGPALEPGDAGAAGREGRQSRAVPRGRSADPTSEGPSGPGLNDAARGERLQRVMADAGVASRRTCESLIEEGRVSVNGSVVSHLPVWVDANRDVIEVDGTPLPKAERFVYILLNKPARTLSTVSDEPGSDRRTVVGLVDHPLAPRLFPVGRLDYDTVGLVLLTNDGELANRLTHPRFGVPKTYRAVVKGRLDVASARQIEDGIYLAERKSGQTVGASRTSRVEIEVERVEHERSVLLITLREGRNRQVRRLMAAVGHPVRSLERVAMGPLKLKGVQRGLWRELTSGELKALRRAAADADRAALGDGDGAGPSERGPGIPDRAMSGLSRRVRARLQGKARGGADGAGP